MASLGSEKEPFPMPRRGEKAVCRSLIVSLGFYFIFVAFCLLLHCHLEKLLSCSLREASRSRKSSRELSAGSHVAISSDRAWDLLGTPPTSSSPVSC